MKQKLISYLIHGLLSAFMLGMLLSGPPLFAADAGDAITLNLKDANIRDVAATISQITHKDFIIDPRVQGRVTVISSRPISTGAVYETFLSVLEVHGLAAIPAGKMVKIVPALEARQMPGPTSTRNQPGDAVVTEVIQVNNVPAAQLVAVLRPLVATESHLVAYPPANVLIISDRAGNVRRIKNLVSRIDQATTNEVEVIPLQYASASDIVRVVTPVVQASAAAQGGGSSAPKLSADQRTNSIIVSGDRADRLRIRALIAHLDTPAKQGGNTQVIYLHYAKAKDLADILKGYSQQLTKSGKGAGGSSSTGAQTIRGHGFGNDVSILPDERTNALVVTAPPKEMNAIKDVISKLDIRRAQVLVQAIVAELTADKSAELGITWAVDALRRAGAAGLTDFSNTGPSIGGLGAGVAAGGASTAGASAGVSVPQGLTIGVGKLVKDGVSFAALLHALAGDSNTNILSTPSLMTLDNEEADIKVGQKVPFVTGSFVNTGATSVNAGQINPFQTVNREEVGLELKITPQINEGNSVVLKIEQQASSLSGSSISGQPVTNDRTIKTNVIANNGEIVVLGGLIDSQLQETEQRVPLLASIPLLGNLFRYRKTTDTRRNLMVFIQPTILRSKSDTSYYTNKRYEQMRALQLRNKNPVQLMPDTERPVMDPLQNLYNSMKPVEPNNDNPVNHKARESGSTGKAVNSSENKPATPPPSSQD